MKFAAIFLISLIVVSLAKSPAEAVLNQIDSFVQASRNEQSSQTKIFIQQHGECTKELSFRTQEVSDAQVASGWAKQQIQINSAALPVCKSSLKQTNSEIKTVQSVLQNVNLEHQVQTDIYLKKQQDVQDALNAISGAYNIIGSFASGKTALSNSAIFLEVSQKINVAFKVAVQHHFHNEMIPLMNTLVQLTANSASTVSTRSLIKAVQLLKGLEKSIKQAGAAWAASNKQLNAIYEAQVKKLTNSERRLTAVSKKLRALLNRLIGTIAKQQLYLRLATDKLDRNQKILSATTSLCAAFDEKYKAQTEQRTQYVALLASLRAFISSAINSFNSGIYSRGDFTNQVQVGAN